MKRIGLLLVVLGAGSFVLHLVGLEFRLLMWIDNWGMEVGWAIRGAMIVAGGALWFLGGRDDSETASAETRQEPEMLRQPEGE